jgi:hypothetical protein
MSNIQLAETIEARLPSHWASLIVNGDESGYEEDEMEEIADTLRSLDVWAHRCVEVGDEAEFELAPSYMPWLLAGSYSTFTFLPGR